MEFENLTKVMQQDKYITCDDPKYWLRLLDLEIHLCLHAYDGIVYNEPSYDDSFAKNHFYDSKLLLSTLM